VLYVQVIELKARTSCSFGTDLNSQTLADSILYLALFVPISDDHIITDEMQI